MNAQIIGWFVFLAIFKNCACAAVYFKLDDSNLTAIEGSCIEIKCKVTYKVSDVGYWFWMKDRKWDKDKGDFNATIIYSTNESIRPVNPNYASRVKYTGAPPSSWIASQNSASNSHPACNILICGLNKTDSGNYSFRFIGTSEKWAADEVNLTVTENPCPITFKKPPDVKASDLITLTCSTLSSCPSNPEIKGQTPSSETLEQRNVTRKSTTVSFQTGWQDDGREFSCQTRNNKDVYLIQNINITVGYAPQNVVAEKSQKDIKEGESVTLTCSAKGHPNPNITWQKDGVQVDSGPKLTFQSIRDSDSGEYRCEAKNVHGSVQSLVSINVTYAPQVEIKTSSVSEVNQGDEITLTCNVMRSNPKPATFAWFKDDKRIDWKTSQYVKTIEPWDKGQYTCTATNTVGTGTSQPLTLNVRYAPMQTTISINQAVKVGQPLQFYCETNANPEPTTYSWYRYWKDKKTNSLQWTSKTTDKSELSLDRVQRADEACYKCNATNSIDTGRNSRELCIKVRYPPTNLILSMDSEVTEGQHINIKCTVDSYPSSDLKLTSVSNPRQLAGIYGNNALQHSFNVTSTDEGRYTCSAQNGEGSEKSTSRMLVVRYRPNNVKVEAKNLTVAENTTLKLHCTAKSNPAVTSYTWMKMVNGKSEIIRNHQKQTMEKLATPSDSGWYRCEATNKIGTGRSEQVEVEVRYAPRNTTTTRTAEKQQGKKSYVTLTCSSESNPVSTYLWYRKTNDKQSSDAKVSDKRSHNVYSDKPGVYYCIANNEISQSRSKEVEVFVEKIYVKVLKFFCLFLLILLVICFLVFIYRRKRNKSIRQGATNTTPCFVFMGWRNCARRRDLMNEPVMAEPFRSRDDLLADQMGRPNAHGRQPLPDSTPAPNITSVYCTVNLPNGKQGPSAQKPVKQQGGQAEDESLNYASIHFGNKKKHKPIKAEENPVYAMVAKQKPPKKNEPHGPEDYENISAAHAAKLPNPSNDETDTSDSEDDDEVELNYAKVSFKAKPGHKRDRKDSSSSTSSETSSSTSSSTSDDEETQYSQVKL